MTSEVERGGGGLSGARSGGRSRGGFTLIELLVVILIIGILAALLVPALRSVQTKALISSARSDLNTFDQALRQYHLDYHLFPGYAVDADSYANAFPEMWEAIMGDPANGKAGKNAPYIDKLDQDDIVVEDIETDQDGNPVYRPADNVEMYDQHTKKYFTDPFDNIYIYRENESKRDKPPWMINRSSYDMWSIGPNGINQSEENDFDRQTGLDASGENYDDIGNW